MQVLNAGTKQGAGNLFSCFFNIVKHETVSYLSTASISSTARVLVRSHIHDNSICVNRVTIFL